MLIGLGWLQTRLGELTSAALRAAILGPWLVTGGICSLILAVSATSAPGRFRRTQQAQTLTLHGLAVILVPAVIYVASRFGLTGA